MCRDNQHSKLAGLRVDDKLLVIKAVVERAESTLAEYSDPAIQADRWYL